MNFSRKRKGPDGPGEDSAPGRARRYPLSPTETDMRFDVLTIFPEMVRTAFAEGVDERVREHLADEELSVGDFILTGGELAAMIVVDAVARLLPGTLGSPDSANRESFTSGAFDYPVYTRPAEFRGMKVPEVLLS